MKITIALALVASGASAWEIPEDAYTQFPIEHLPRDETGGIDHGRELWKYWEPPKAMTECFDYDKCKSCWMKECTEEADDAYNACRKWDEMKTDWMMQEGGKCEKEKLNPSKAGDREMCQAYGECVYKDCGYDCDNCKGPRCDGGDDSDDSDDSSSSDDCKKDRKQCKRECRREHDRRLTTVAAEITDEERRLGSNKLKQCYRSCKSSFRDCKDD